MEKRIKATLIRYIGRLYWVSDGFLANPKYKVLERGKGYQTIDINLLNEKSVQSDEHCLAKKIELQKEAI